MHGRRMILPIAMALATLSGCSSDNHGTPQSANLVELDVDAEGYKALVAKMTSKNGPVLQAAFEGRVAAAFNQDGLHLSITGPGTFIMNVRIGFLNEDDSLVPNLFSQQPLDEQYQVNNDRVDLSVSYDELVKLVNKSVLGKHIDIADALNDGSIRVTINTAVDKATKVVGGSQQATLVAGYFTGDFDDLFEIPEFTHNAEHTFETSDTSTTLTTDGKGNVSISTTTTSTDEATVRLTTEGPKHDLARIPENYSSYYKDPQKIVVDLDDENEDSVAKFAGTLEIETVKAHFTFLVNGLDEGQRKTVSLAQWAGPVINATLKGQLFVNPDDGIGETVKMDEPITLR